MTLTTLAVAAIFVGCNVLLPTAPPLPPEIIAAEYRRAQEKIATVYGRPAAWAVPQDRFTWTPMSGPFECAGVLSNGCFQTRGHVIAYNVNTPGVISHEAGHGILHVLGSVWECFEHGC